MKKLIFIFISSLFFLTATAQLKKFTVDVPYAPLYEISDSIQSITIMNRSMTSGFQDYDEKQLQISFYRKNFESNTVLLDSTAADTTIKVMGDLLYNSLRYDVVIPVERNIYRLLDYTETPAPLAWDYVRSLCELYQTDALLVLENQALRVVSNYQSGIDYTNYGAQKYHYASIDFYGRSHWRLYDPRTESIVSDVVMNQDTIFWDHYDYDLADLFASLPTIKQATIDAAIKSALDYSELIAPRWKSETRYYYVMKQALIDRSVKLAADGNWQEALDNWLLYIDQGSKSKRSKIMLNAALAYEMTGRLDKAIEMIKLSQNTYYRQVSNHYLKTLLKRQIALKN